MINSNNQDSKEKDIKPGIKSFFKKNMAVIITIAVLVLLSVFIFLYKQIEINNLQKLHAEEIKAININAKKAFNDNTIFYMETIGRVFSWAVRSEIQRQNMEQVNLMMTELVKVKNFKQIVILSSDGSVLLSTDKKFEGSGFPKIVYDMVKTENTKSSIQENGDIFIVSPVFGLDKKIGTIIITYTPEKVNFIKANN